MSETKNVIRGHLEANDGKVASIAFTVFGNPVPKERPRTVRKESRYKKASVRTYTPAKTKNYETAVALVYKSIYGTFMFEKDIPLKADISFYIGIPKSEGNKKRNQMLCGEIRPTKRNGDTDNFLKCATDALNGVAYEDDAQIVEIIGKKYYSDKPRTEIRIAPIGGAEIKNDYGVTLDRNGYAPSIMGEQSRCYICGRTDRTLNRHEVYHGSNRKKSKALGLWVTLCDLCHDRLHHKEGKTDLDLKQKMQLKAMEVYEWDEDAFRRIVGKSYL